MKFSQVAQGKIPIKRARLVFQKAWASDRSPIKNCSLASLVLEVQPVMLLCSVVIRLPGEITTTTARYNKSTPRNECRWIYPLDSHQLYANFSRLCSSQWKHILNRHKFSLNGVTKKFSWILFQFCLCSSYVLFSR